MPRRRFYFFRLEWSFIAERMGVLLLVLPLLLLLKPWDLQRDDAVDDARIGEQLWSRPVLLTLKLIEHCLHLLYGTLTVALLSSLFSDILIS